MHSSLQSPDVELPGWFLLLSSLAGFYRVKRWEKSIRAASSPQGASPTPEPHRNMNRAFPEIFLFRAEDENDERREQRPPMTEADERLTRDLRAAGLL